MFVRWRKRAVFDGYDNSLDAILVSGKRENGKVKQIFIKHLSSISERYIEKLNLRISFWARADRSLVSLGLNPKIRRSLECQLSAIVPRPKEFEMEQYKEEMKLELTNYLAEMDKKIAGRKFKQYHSSNSNKMVLRVISKLKQIQRREIKCTGKAE